MIRCWLDRGVDGFRMDVINFISKEPGLPDAPVTDPASPWQSAITLHSCGPRLHEFLQGIGAILKEYDAFSVGEMPGVGDEKEVMKSVGQEREELNMIFHFELYGPPTNLTCSIQFANPTDLRYNQSKHRWPTPGQIPSPQLDPPGTKTHYLKMASHDAHQPRLECPLPRKPRPTSQYLALRFRRPGIPQAFR